jgi:hypothetical protein
MRLIHQLRIILVVVSLVAPLAGSSAAAVPVGEGWRPAEWLSLSSRVTGFDYWASPGCAAAFAIERTPGRENVGFVRQSRADGDLTVVQADAVPLVEQGRLDPRLFDVTELVRQGHSDAKGKLPLIVSYRQAVPETATAATIVRELPSINGAAVAQDS